MFSAVQREGLPTGAGALTADTISRGSGSASGGGGGGAAPAPCGMECGVAGGFPVLSPTERSPAKTGLHVNFSDKGEVKERREKFLTAKYGSHQMALIRKRLAVEMWLYDELQKLYEPSHPEGGGAGAGAGAAATQEDVEVDVDELLDMESDEVRRAHLAKLLADAKKPLTDVNKFINELLEKAKTL